ncbi:hypothetical protein GUY44_04945 [Pimelobacter simplex]|nr:hypothetical protein [Pimelobacter simplex]MCG8149816.1 hypothetical protein [Pimelobacter simplex]GEB13975.1 hypothetical protein NSI01_22900 [Pimelobacter simplex]SFM65683.1 hypothetical protein SAMN05421671_2696 [Pimelobacter simplex]
MERNNADNPNNADTRARIVDLLMDKVAEDAFPSIPMMTLLEDLLEPDEVPAYAAVLMQKISETNYPSVSMLARLASLAGND